MHNTQCIQVGLCYAVHNVSLLKTLTIQCFCFYINRIDKYSHYFNLSLKHANETTICLSANYTSLLCLMKLIVCYVFNSGNKLQWMVYVTDVYIYMIWWQMRILAVVQSNLQQWQVLSFTFDISKLFKHYTFLCNRCRSISRLKVMKMISYAIKNEMCHELFCVQRWVSILNCRYLFWYVVMYYRLVSSETVQSTVSGDCAVF